MDITGMAVDNLLMSQVTAEIGCVRKTMKDPVNFSNEILGEWKLMNGQSCAGTQYEIDFGSSNVPDAYTDGTFLRQAKPGRGIGTYEDEDTAPHTHPLSNTVSANAGGYNDTTTCVVSTERFGLIQTVTATANSGVETRPKNIAVNFMIKVNH